MYVIKSCLFLFPDDFIPQSGFATVALGFSSQLIARSRALRYVALLVYHLVNHRGAEDNDHRGAHGDNNYSHDSHNNHNDG